MERAEVAKATGYAGEMEVELRLLREDQEQVRSSTVLTELVIKPQAAKAVFVSC